MINQVEEYLKELECKYKYSEETNSFFMVVPSEKKRVSFAIFVEDKSELMHFISSRVKDVTDIENKLQLLEQINEYNVSKVVFGTLGIRESKVDDKTSIVYTHSISISGEGGLNKNQFLQYFNYVIQINEEVEDLFKIEFRESVLNGNKL